MSWSSSAPTLPSGESWGAATTGATVISSNYSATITVEAARGIGNTYYIRVTGAFSTGEGGTFNPPDLYFVANGEGTSIGRPSRWSNTVRYYTGSSSAAVSVTAGESTSSTSISSGSARATASVPAPRYWTVSYNGNGATGGSTASQTKTRDAALTLRSNGFTRTGYVFVKWNTAADGTGTSYAAGGSYTANAAAVLYAIWKRANIPVFVNTGGAIRQVEKAYANIGGTIKECAVFVNVNDQIIELK